LCYDLFFVAGFIYVDKKASPAIRAQAQGFLVLVTQGLGLGIGAILFSKLVGRFTVSDESGSFTDWRNVWYIAAGFAALVLVTFMIFFREKKETAEVAPLAMGQEEAK
jgi:MFS family permease